jgi:predicted nuclease of predicted toxin-antitoxin system
MRIKLDENMPGRLAEALARAGHDIDTVIGEGLAGCDDEAVWSGAQECERFFITQDMDFSDLRRFAFGKHEGVMLVRLREPGRTALLNRISAVLETEDCSSWKGAFVVVTDSKTRVRKPER